MAKSEPSWKDKYLKAIDEQDRLEKVYDGRVQLLRRGLVRVSLAGDGLDSQLDDELSELRSQLRKESAEKGLSVILDRIEQSVLRLENCKAKRIDTIQESLNIMLEQLLKLAPPRKVKSALKKYQKTIDNRAHDPQEYDGLLKEYAGIQRQTLQVTASDVDEKEINKKDTALFQRCIQWLLEKMAGKSTPEEAKTPKPTAPNGIKEKNDHIPEPQDRNIFDDFEKTNKVETIVQVEQITKKKEKDDGSDEDDENNQGNRNNEDNKKNNETSNKNDIIDTIEKNNKEKVTVSANMDINKPRPPEPGFSTIATKVSDILLNLLEQLVIPETVKTTTEGLRQRIDYGMNWYEFVPVLEDMSTVVIASLGYGRKEFEDFLEALNNRLNDVQEFLTSSQADREQAKQNSLELDAAVRGHVNHIAHHVTGATDLDDLKRSVTLQLDHIVASMDNFKSLEEDRDVTVAKQLSALVSRVESMEEESRTFREQLEVQRSNALLDSLTQLPNREAYEQRLKLEYSRWKRYGDELTLVMGDVDWFKKVNDTYGHLAGDKVLKILSKEMSGRIRETDFVGRYGGEEFVFLMPNTRQQEALAIMEKIRHVISRCPFHFRGENVEVTMSFGITGFIKDDKPQDAFIRADKALYAAKESGRNCCRIGEP